MQHCLFPLSALISVLALLLVSHAQAQSQTPNPGPAQSENTVALVISGGISLGVYEAGLNHVVIESLRDAGSGLPRLATTTGASAGAINTIASALRYCESTAVVADPLDNGFRDIWIDVGIEGLLPSRNQEYEQLVLGGVTPGDEPQVLRDSVLNRSIFHAAVQGIRTQVETGNFRPGCKVYMGMMVTLAQPRYAALLLSDGAEILTQEQSYAIPLLLETQARADGSIGAVFRNPERFEALEVNRNFIFLPQHDTGEVSLESVIRASLASSAFPLAFGAVELGYCFKSEIVDVSGHCPAGYSFNQSIFIDGGYFNNIPIGLAAELLALEVGRQPSEPSANGMREQYIFMDPDALRGRQRVPPGDSAYGNLDIVTQLGNILPGIGTLRKADLYNDYDLHFTSPHTAFRQYRPTGRSPALTGNFLAAFGAFLDRNFREYDYAAGIYDGLVYSAGMICEAQNKAQDDVCHANTFRQMFFKHFPEVAVDAPGVEQAQRNQALLAMQQQVARFLFEEFNAGRSRAWADLAQQLYDDQFHSPLRVVHEAIQYSGENNFDSFLDALQRSSQQYKRLTGHDVQFSERTQYMLNRRDFWKHALAKNALQRLIFLEERDGGPHKAKLSAAYIMISDDMFVSNEFGSTRFPTENYWTHFITPDHIGFDAVQTGVMLGWAWIPKWRVPFTYMHFELGPNFHIQIGDDARSLVNYVDYSVGIRQTFPGTLLSSVGGAINVNQNLSNRSRFGQDYMTGIELNAGLLADKLRFTVGTRNMIDNYVGEDWTARLSINNLDELFWAFWP